MGRKEQRKLIYDTAVSVEAGYPEKRFFPTYNGYETPHADLLSKLELLYEGEGLLIDCVDGRSPDVVRADLHRIISRHNLRPPPGHWFKLRKYRESEKHPWKILITVRRYRTKRDKSRAHIIIDFESRTESQIERDKLEEQKAVKEYHERMAALQRRREAEKEYNSPEAKAKRDAEYEAKKAEKERLRLEQKEQRRLDREKAKEEARRKLAEEIREKDRLREKMRKERSKQMKRIKRRKK